MKGAEGHSGAVEDDEDVGIAGVVGAGGEGVEADAEGVVGWA